MKFMERIKQTILASIVGLGFLANAFDPPLDVPLNDFPPERAVGYYIQEISSNQVVSIVKLTNGVLSVGSESINIAEPSHTVVETNYIDNVPIITTNTYQAVYEDGMKKTLQEYATIEKIISITTNSVGEVTTNKTKVAYLSDIPPDDKKADKVMSVWDFAEVSLGIVLERIDDTNAPFSSWKWMGDKGEWKSLALFNTNGVWNLSKNGNPYIQKVGSLEESPLTIDVFTFVATNQANVLVVYSDEMKREINTRLNEYVAKTNLSSIAQEITGERLKTIGGIAETLQGIKSAVNKIAGMPTMKFRLAGDLSGQTVLIGNADMTIEGDRVVVNWGDGTEETNVALPASHTYGTIDNHEITITIGGFVSAIYGNGASNLSFVCATNASGTITYSIPISFDTTIGLKKIGAYSFENTAVTDLFFLPSTIDSIGKYAFTGSGLTSLGGMPTSVTNIADYCFSQSSSLSSLAGISRIKNLGIGCFSSCSISSLQPLSDTRIYSISAECFSGNPITSMDGLPTTVTNIGNSAFYNTELTNISGLPSGLQSIGNLAFSGNQGLVSVDFSSTSLKKLGSEVFQSCTALGSIRLPSTVEDIASTTFTNILSSSIVLIMTSKTVDDIQNMNNFAWGLPNDSGTPGQTTITCGNGNLTSQGDGTWLPALSETMFYLDNIPAGQHIVTLGEVVPTSISRVTKRAGTRVAPTGGYYISWGDGTIDMNSSHVYNFSSVTNIKISIFGVLDSISGTLDAPFISIDGNRTNRYLTAFILGDAVSLKAFGISAFKNCINLSQVELPASNKSVESFGESCFENTDVRFPSFVTNTAVVSLSKACFKGTPLQDCSDFFRSIVSIGDECFMSCTNLLVFPEVSASLDTLGKDAFRGCSSLPNIGELTNTQVSVIADGCFRECTSLIELPNHLEGITSIGKDAFSGCTKLSDLNMPTVRTIGDNAFLGAGTAPSVPTETDSDGFEYKLLLNCDSMSYVEVAQIFGLIDGEIGETRTGIDPNIAKFICSDGDLLYNSGASSRWEVLMPAIEFELKDVPNGTTFTVATTRPYEDASLVWNWGDGNVARWITSSPEDHTYNNSSVQSYVVKVKGLLKSISSPSPDIGAYVRPVNENENPYLYGFKIPENTPLQSVGSYSFSRCPSLKNINTLNLPRSRAAPLPIKRDASKSRLENLSTATTRGVVTYGEGAFIYSGIEDVSGLPNDLDTLPSLMFAYNFNLASLYGLPDGLLDIQDSAFRGDSALIGLSGWPSAIGYISAYCFADCNNLMSLEALSGIPITQIGEGSFYGCNSLQSLYGLSPYLKTIGMGAFQGSGITSLEAMPSSVTNLGEASFAQCQNLTSLDGISPNLEALPPQAFFDCTNLTDAAILSSNTKELKELSLAVTDRLTNIVISSYITNVGYAAVGGASGGIEPWTDEDGNSLTCVIQFPGRTCKQIHELWEDNFSNTVASVKLQGRDGYIVNIETNWVDMLNTMEFHLTSLAPNTRISLGKITLAKGSSLNIDWGDGTYQEQCPSVGNSHLYTDGGDAIITLIGRISKIESATPPSPFIVSDTPNMQIADFIVGNNVGLAELGDSCFRELQYLTKIYNISNSSISAIGTNCFAGCSNLTNLDNIPIGIKTIRNHAFADCTSLTEISVLTNTGLLILEASAFEGCTALASLKGLRQEIIEIPNYCFAGCTSLQSLDDCPTNIIKIGEGAFSGCTSLNSIEAIKPILNLELGKKAFLNCSSLTTLNGFLFGDMGRECFAGCSNLESLNGFWGAYTPLPIGCFSNCINLVSIDAINSFSNSIPLNPYCFYGCSKVDFPFVSTNLTMLLDSAFEGCNLSSLTSVTEQVESIGKRCFANTAIRDLTIPYYKTEKIGTDAFADEHDVPVQMLQGFETTRIIRLPNIGVIDIMDSPFFPWGASERTRFIGADGYIVYYNGAWAKIQKSLEAELKLSMPFEGKRYEFPPGPYTGQDVRWTNNYNNVVLKGLQPSSEVGILVDWGDGTLEHIMTDEPTNHLYTQAGDYIVRIDGTFSTLGTRGTFLTPSLYITGIHGDRASSYTPDSAFFRNQQYNDTSSGELSNCVVRVSVYDTSEATIIGDEAFANMRGMTNFPQLPTITEVIGKRCFANCTAINVCSGLPVNTMEIGEEAFAGCTYLSNMYWTAGNVLKIPTGAFKDCSNLRTFLTLTNMMITTIGEFAFSNCTRLVEVDLSNSQNFNSIEDNAFMLCSRLDTIKFAQCSSLSANLQLVRNGVRLDFRNTQNELYIMGGGANQMWGAGHQTTFMCNEGQLKYDNGQTQWILVKGKNYLILDNVKANEVFCINPLKTDASYSISWGDGTVEQYDATVASISHQYLRDGMFVVSLIGDIKEVNGIESQKPWFYKQDALKTTNVVEMGLSGDTITNLGNYALSGYSYVTNVVLGNSIIHIGDECFSGCEQLSLMMMPTNNNLEIGAEVFSNCQHVVVVFPSTKIPHFSSSSFSHNTGRFGFPNLSNPFLPNSIDEAGGISEGASLFTVLGYVTNGINGLYIGNNSIRFTLKNVRKGDTIKLGVCLTNSLSAAYWGDDTNISGYIWRPDSEKVCYMGALAVRPPWATQNNFIAMSMGEWKPAHEIYAVIVWVEGETRIDPWTGHTYWLPGYFATILHEWRHEKGIHRRAPIIVDRIPVDNRMVHTYTDDFNGDVYIYVVPNGTPIRGMTEGEIGKLVPCITDGNDNWPTNITEIRIGNEAPKLGAYSFARANVQNLNIVSEDNLPMPVSEGFFAYSNLEDPRDLVTPISFPTQHITDVYLGNLYWNSRIPPACFLGCTNMTSVEWMEDFNWCDLVETYPGTFDYCGLKSLKGFPTNLNTRMGFRNHGLSFRHNASLREIWDFPQSALQLNFSGCFEGCTNLNSIIPPQMKIYQRELLDAFPHELPHYWLKGISCDEFIAHGDFINMSTDTNSCIFLNDGIVWRKPPVGVGTARAYLDFKVVVQAESTTVSLGKIVPSSAFYTAIDWGDGTMGEFFSKDNLATIYPRHTYDHIGAYTIRIIGFIDSLGPRIKDGQKFSFVSDFNSMAPGIAGNVKLQEFDFTDESLFRTCDRDTFFMEGTESQSFREIKSVHVTRDENTLMYLPGLVTARTPSEWRRFCYIEQWTNPRIELSSAAIPAFSGYQWETASITFECTGRGFIAYPFQTAPGANNSIEWFRDANYSMPLDNNGEPGHSDNDEQHYATGCVGHFHLFSNASRHRVRISGYVDKEAFLGRAINPIGRDSEGWDNFPIYPNKGTMLRNAGRTEIISVPVRWWFFMGTKFKPAQETCGNKIHRILDWDSSTNAVVDVGAFSGYSDLTSIAAWPSRLVEIRERAFEETGMCTWPTIPTTCTNIGHRAFASRMNSRTVKFATPVARLKMDADVFGDVFPNQTTLNIDFSGTASQVKAMSGFPFCKLHTSGPLGTLRQNIKNTRIRYNCLDKTIYPRWNKVGTEEVWTWD